MQTMEAHDAGWLALSNNTAIARAAAIQIVPELEGFQWMDQYFDQTDLEILAVFDHDTFLMAAHRLLVLFLLVVVMVVLWIIRPDLERPERRSYPLGAMGMLYSRQFDRNFDPRHPAGKQPKPMCCKPAHLLVVSCILAMLMSCFWITNLHSPHTAVTTGGVMFVTGGSVFRGGGGA